MGIFCLEPYPSKTRTKSVEFDVKISGANSEGFFLNLPITEGDPPIRL